MAVAQSHAAPHPYSGPLSCVGVGVGVGVGAGAGALVDGDVDENPEHNAMTANNVKSRSPAALVRARRRAILSYVVGERSPQARRGPRKSQNRKGKKVSSSPPPCPVHVL